MPRRSAKRASPTAGWCAPAMAATVAARQDRSAIARSAATTRRWILAVGALALLILGAAAAWCQSGLAAAHALARHGLWTEVHAPLARFLLIRPRNPAANLLCAEALVKDDSQPLFRRITESIARLERIPDRAPEGAQARIATARIQLFLRYEPSAAWHSLQRALALDPESLEANLLSWRLLELLGRIDDVEPFFWRSYELSPAADRPLRLREWYASQFFPQSSLADLDTLMGFRQAPSDPPDLVEGRRLQRFLRAEPDQPWNHAALARWFLSRAEPDFSRELLNRSRDLLTDEQRCDPFYVATEIDVCCELGEGEQARAALERWPSSDRGRRYDLARGRVLQEAGDDPAGAVTAYDAALAIWPGPVDWRTVTRVATCLARTGDEAGAAARREEARRIEQLMQEAFHKQLFRGLANLGDPAVLSDAEAFYRGLGRDREADGWAAARAVVERGRGPGDTDSQASDGRQ
jgi:tetratricopeptide (TPR) repeat protein